MREETVTVKIDHPLGSTDEDNPSVVWLCRSRKNSRIF